MNLYVSNIEKYYKDTIIGHLGNLGTAYNNYYKNYSVSVHAMVF